MARAGSLPLGDFRAAPHATRNEIVTGAVVLILGLAGLLSAVADRSGRDAKASH